MVATVEIISCLAAIAGSVKWAATEYVRQQKSRQMNEALRSALGEMA